MISRLSHSTKVLNVLGFLSVALFALPASAATLFDVSAQLNVRAISTGPNPLSAQNAGVMAALGLELGSGLHATYRVDSSVPATIDDDFGTEYFVYNAVLGSVTESSGGVFMADLQQTAAIAILDSDPGAPDIFTISTRGSIQTSIGAVDFRLNTVLTDESGGALSTPELDLSVFDDLALWDDALNTGLLLTLTFPDGEFANINAEFIEVSVTAVPLPGAIVLFVSALLGLGSIRKLRT